MSTIRSNFIGPLTGTSLPTLSASPVLMDAKAYNWNSLTTNTYLDFDSTVSSTLSGVSGIPTWAKRITVMFAGVSVSGTSSIRIQIGSGSVETSGYTGSTSTILSASAQSNTTGSAGFDLYSASAIQTSAATGAVVLYLLGSNQWVASGWVGYDGGGQSESINGRKTTSGTLDRVRITTVNGTDTFDAGSVSVMYE